MFECSIFACSKSNLFAMFQNSDVPKCLKYFWSRDNNDLVPKIHYFVITCHFSVTFTSFTKIKSLSINSRQPGSIFYKIWKFHFTFYRHRIYRYKFVIVDKFENTVLGKIWGQATSNFDPITRDAGIQGPDSIRIWRSSSWVISNLFF